METTPKPQGHLRLTRGPSGWRVERQGPAPTDRKTVCTGTKAECEAWMEESK